MRVRKPGRSFSLPAIAAAAVLLIGLTGSAAAADRPSASVRAAMTATTTGADVASMRTEFSRTRRLAGGVFETTLSGKPLNFRAAGGAWQPIDNRLERRSGGTFETRTNSIEVEIPATADGEVRFGDDDEAVGFSLVGAPTRAADVDGGLAAYADVKPDTDLSYEVDGKVLKETLTLASADALTSYRFDVDAGGLRPELGASGDVEFVDDEGRQQLGFQAPWMRDADGAITRGAHYELDRVDGRDQVVLRLDSEWLRRPGRRFPVVVDPTVYSGWEHVCEIRSGARSNTTQCVGDLSETWVGRDARGIVYRDVFELQDLSAAVPDHAQILDSWFAVYLNGQNPVEPSDVDLHHLTRAFAPGVTWNRTDGRTLWSRAGGDYELQRLQRISTGDADPSDGWMAFDIAELARSLVAGAESSPNLLLKAADESRAHTDSFDDAEVMVRWHPRTGISPRYTYESFDLSDGSTLRQNMANGNLVLSSNDLGWEAADGRSPTIRYFNSLGLLQGDFPGTFGDGSQGSFGSIRLERNPLQNSYAFAGPSGLVSEFQRQTDGTFRLLDGPDATLTELPDDMHSVQFADSGETWHFDEDGDLDQTSQTDGYTIDITWGRSGLETLSDSAGHTATLGYDRYDHLRTITDQDSAVHRYDYDGSDRLVTYTNPAGGQTSYVYDGSDRLSRINLPDRTALKIAYPGGAQHASAITPVNAAGVDQTATSYDGDRDWTSSERPGAPRTVYFYDPNTLVVDLIQSGSDAAIATSGLIPSLDGDYTRGDTALTVDVSAAQAPDGIQLTELEFDGVEIDSVGDAPCDQNSCPSRARETLSYDSTFDADGAHEFRVNTVDGDDERTDGPLWRVRIDRTAPTAASDIAFVGIDEGAAEFEWENGSDPDAPDATPGSGLALSQVRYRVGPSGTWSGWAGAEEESLWVPGLTYGQQVTVEVREVDRVGNEAPVASETITLAEPETEDSVLFDVDENGNPVVPPPSTTERASDPLPTGVCVRGPFRAHPSPYFISVLDDKPRSPQVVNRVMLQATIIQECINPPGDAQITQMQLRACVRMVGKDGQAHNQVCDKKIESARAGEFFLDQQVKLDLNLLCRPGTRSYEIRTYTRVKQTPTGVRAKRVAPKADSFAKDTLDCDEADAWIYQATHTPAAGPSAPDGWRNLSQIRTWTSPSSYLRSRMGQPPTADGDWAAHHIVAARGWSTRRSDRSQAAAYKCGIDPNNPTNGAWLRGPGLDAGTDGYENLRPMSLRGRAYHQRIHTTVYFVALANRLEPLVRAWPEDCRAEMRERLNTITNSLYTNAFPYRPADEEPIWTDD